MNKIEIIKKYGIIFVLLLLIVFFSVTTEHFFSTNNLLNILRQSSMFGIVVVGVTFAMISRGPDLSVGGQMAVIGMIGAILMVNLNVPILLSILICLISGALIGAFNGILAVKLNIFPLIVTLGTMLMFEGLAYVITGGYPIFGLPEKYMFLGQGYIWKIPVPVIIFVLITIIAWFILNKTYFGRYIYAIGGDEEVARLSGINVDKYTVIIYSLTGFITSISALIMLSRTNSAQPGAGASYPFDCMTAAVLGGISMAGGQGNVLGAVIGVLIIGVLNNGLILMGVNSNWQGVIKGLVLIAAVGLDSIQAKSKNAKKIAV